MGKLNEGFKKLLSDGIARVKLEQNGTIKSVEIQIADKFHVSHELVRSWKKGNVPNDKRVEKLLEYCAKNGKLDKIWGESFLRHAGHPYAKGVLDDLFPPAQELSDQVPPVPDNLPARSDIFIGREQELKKLFEWLQDSRWPLASIEGMGGIGKTSLALQVSHGCSLDSNFKDLYPFKAIVWTNANDYIDFDLGLNYILDTVVKVLGRSPFTEDRLDRKRERIIDLLRNNPIFLIIDNYEAIVNWQEEWKSFLQEIPEGNKVLITTRTHELRPATDFHLKGLNEEESIALIRKQCALIDLADVDHVKDKTLLELASATGSNPQAMVIALRLIKEKGLNFNSIIANLQEVGEAGDSSIADEVFDYIFGEAWKLLDQPAKQILFVMTLFTSSAGRTALFEIAGVQNKAFEDAIAKLQKLFLIEIKGHFDDEIYVHVHPLTKTYAQSKIDRSQDTSKVPNLRKKYCDFFTNWSKQKTSGDYWAFRYWDAEVLEGIQGQMSELKNSVNWSSKANRWGQVLQLTKAIIHPLFQMGRIEERIKYSEWGIRATNELNNVEDRIWFYLDGLGLVYLLQHNADRAMIYIKEGISLAEEYDLSNAMALGYVYRALDKMQKKDFLKAQDYVAQALELTEDHYYQYRAHRLAGHIARHLEKYEDAKDYYSKASQFLILNSSAVEYLVIPDVWLGFVNLKLSDLDEAESNFIRILETSNYTNHRSEALSNFGLALVYKERGELDKVHNFANEAHSMTSQMNFEWETQGIKELMNYLEDEAARE